MRFCFQNLLFNEYSKNLKSACKLQSMILEAKIFAAELKRGQLKTLKSGGKALNKLAMY
jgi:hypothetical protein